VSLNLAQKTSQANQPAIHSTATQWHKPADAEPKSPLEAKRSLPEVWECLLARFAILSIVQQNKTTTPKAMPRQPLMEMANKPTLPAPFFRRYLFATWDDVG
jgi:hypothetical protein